MTALSHNLNLLVIKLRLLRFKEDNRNHLLLITFITLTFEEKNLEEEVN